VADERQILAIKRAVRANDHETVRRLLRDDPHLALVRGHGWTPFQDAAFQGKTACMRVMLSEGVGISPTDIAQGLHHAVQLPHIDSEMVEVLLGTGKVSQPFCLLFRGDLDALAGLLAASPDVVHERDAAGCPLIVRAAENAEEQIVRVLLEHGGDIEARGPFGKSALSSCSCNQVDRKKRARTLRFLLNSGAAVNGRTWRGRTALFSAATAGWAPEQSVKILVKYGADINLRNDEGRTALEEVLLQPSARSHRVAQLLRQAGAQA
jgi:ankyrin repeat protein